jgi:hypothetical protein
MPKRDWYKGFEQTEVIVISVSRKEQRYGGCHLIPNGDFTEQKTNWQDSSTMRGLVF